MSTALKLSANACQCFAHYDNNGVLHPQLCPAHNKLLMAERIKFGYVKYERAFERECDALDRQHIILHLMKREDTRAKVVKVGRFWVVLASWGLVKVDGWAA